MKNITIKEYKEIVNNGEDKIIIFSAPWCGPCRMFKPQLELFEKNKSIPVYSVDIENPEFDSLVREELGIKSVPTTYLYNKDKQMIFSGANIAQVNSFFE